MPGISRTALHSMRLAESHSAARMVSRKPRRRCIALRGEAEGGGKEVPRSVVGGRGFGTLRRGGDGSEPAMDIVVVNRRSRRSCFR